MVSSVRSLDNGLIVNMGALPNSFSIAIAVRVFAAVFFNQHFPVSQDGLPGGVCDCAPDDSGPYSGNPFEIEGNVHNSKQKPRNNGPYNSDPSKRLAFYLRFSGQGDNDRNAAINKRGKKKALYYFNSKKYPVRHRHDKTPPENNFYKSCTAQNGVALRLLTVYTVVKNHKGKRL